MPSNPLQAFELPLPADAKLTRKQWHELDTYLREWKREVLAAARRHPARSFELGREQINAFLNLLGKVGVGDLPPTSAGMSPTSREAQAWVKEYTLHELDASVDRYLDQIKSALLYGLQGAHNPVDVASMLYNATQDSTVNWRMIARTEVARASAAGRLEACAQMGYTRVWCPPHVGSCKKCRQLLEGKDFDIDKVRHATNYGRKAANWMPCIPLHPHCRHVWLPYEPEVVDEARRQHAAMREAGWTDRKIDDLFDESGQLKPEHAGTDLSAFKGHDPYTHALGVAVEKASASQPLVIKGAGVRRMVLLDDLRTDLYQRQPDPTKIATFRDLYERGKPPEKPPIVSYREDGTHWLLDGQHRVEGAKAAGWVALDCDIREDLTWEDESRICREAMGENPMGGNSVANGDKKPPVAKGYFDPEQADLDPLLWQDGKLRRDVRNRIIGWASTTLGQDWPRWAAIYVTGGAASLAWEGIKHPEWDPDVDLQLVIDWPQFREHRRDWAVLSSPDLHAALVTLVKAATAGVQIVPGVDLDAFVRPEQTPATFEQAVRTTGQPVWDVRSQDWLVPPGHQPEGELYGSPWLEGIGARVAIDHPEWLAAARAIVTELQATLDHYHADQAPSAFRTLRDAYTAVHDARALSFRPGGGGEHGKGNFIWQYAWNYGPLHQIKLTVHPEPLAKLWPGATVDVAKAKVAPNTGVEHWITVHPNGADEPGQPVLVRNNADGTMSVIGGAGGHLNYLRLDPSRRVDKPDDGQPKEKPPEQHLSQAEADQALREHQGQVDKAKAHLASLDVERNDNYGRMLDYITGQLGDDALKKHRTTIDADGNEHTELVDASKGEIRQAIKQVMHAALQTRTYGAADKADVNEAPPLISEKVDKADRERLDPDEREVLDNLDAADKADEQPDDGEKEKVKESWAPLALSDDQAQQLLVLQEADRQLRKQQSKLRKVIGGNGDASDAYSLNWREGIDEKVAQRASEKRKQDTARSLLESADSPTNRSRYGQAFTRGGFDTLDGFSHAILGNSVVSDDAHKLLGIAGSAQLVAWGIAREENGAWTDQRRKKVLGALNAVRDERDEAISQRGLTRARTLADEASQLAQEAQKSEAGESLYTTTMANAAMQEKLQGASRSLGMAIGGFEASSALQVALDTKKVDGQITVGGFQSPSKVLELADKAGVKVTHRDIRRVGTGNFELSIPADRLAHLIKPKPVGNRALRDELRNIRTGKGMAKAITDAQHTPGMSDELDRNQAKGKLFLEAAGSGILDFEPGVGKTHTALAAAMQLMNDEPDKHHKCLIVCPSSVQAAWAKTIRQQNVDGRRTVEIVGNRWDETNPDTLGTSMNPGQRSRSIAASQADFQVITPELAQRIATDPDGLAGKHSIIVADEAQTFKNEGNKTSRALRKLSENSEHRWALTGTPVEKDVQDIHSLLSWVDPGRFNDRNGFRASFGKLGQEEELARTDKIAQFREGALDEHLFHLSASDAEDDQTGEPPPAKAPDIEHNVDLDPEHRQELLGIVKQINQERAGFRDRGESVPKGWGLVKARQLTNALLLRPHNAMARETTDMVSKLGNFDHKGAEYTRSDGSKDPSDHAGKYEPKAVIFHDEAKPLAVLEQELAAKGIKCFKAYGPDVDPRKNSEQIKAFLAHKGKAVFLTTSRNEAGVSLQFGNNKGRFQHGATHMIHYGLPDNAARLQQRDARILRKGAQAQVQYHTLNAGTPAEARQRDRLAAERRTQQLVGTSEETVSSGGKDAETRERSLRQHLDDRGVKPPAT